MDTLRLAGIIAESIVDGPGIRFVLFTQGCPHHCEGCHNPETHDFSKGTDCDIEKIARKIKKNPIVRGVTFSGGEPMCQARALAPLAKILKESGYHLACYTGYTFEELLDRQNPGELALLSFLDLLIDGKFLLAQKDLTLKFRGSKNQRILNVPESLLQKKAILAEI